MGCIDDNMASRRAAAVRMVVIMYLSSAESAGM